jgi:hypothetical protein
VNYRPDILTNLIVSENVGKDVMRPGEEQISLRLIGN